MAKKRFIVNAIILTIFTLIMRTVGTFFGVYLSNKVGAEGIGLYQLVCSVYALAITFSISGIGIAIVRLVSEQVAKNNLYRAKVAFRRCLYISIILSVLTGFAMFINAHWIGTYFLKDARTIMSLKLLSIELPFLAISACIRNYFIALKMINHSIAGDLLEQVLSIATTIPIVTMMLPSGVEYACCAVVIGSMIGEILSCVYVIFVYIYKNKQAKSIQQPTKGLWRSIFSIAFPVAFGNYIRQTLSTIENVLIPSGLKKFGASSGASLAQYGMIKGMVMPILAFPSAILGAFSCLLIPEVSESNAVKNKARINYIITKSLKTTLLFSLVVTGIYFSFSKDLGILIYNSEQSGKLLFILTPLIPLLYLDCIVDSILKGLNQQMSAMKYNTADSIMRVTLIYFLIPNLGVNGYIIVLFIGTIFNFSMSLNRLIKVSRIKLRITDWILKPSFATLLSCVISTSLFNIFALSNLSLMNATIFKITTILILYYVILRLIGCISKRDVKWIKKIIFTPKEAV